MGTVPAGGGSGPLEPLRESALIPWLGEVKEAVMARQRYLTLGRVLLTVMGLGVLAACRDEAERGRDVVLEAGYVFTISDFHRAAGAGQGKVVEQFLAAGMKADAMGVGGETALHLAAAGGHPHVVAILLDAGAVVDSANTMGMTPLMEAARAGDGVSVLALRKAGADPARRDRQGHTALAAAAGAGHAAVVDLLVPDTKGPLEEVLELACREGHTGVIDGLLKVVRADGDERVDWGHLLKEAAGGGHLPAVRLISSRMPRGGESAVWHGAAVEAARAAGQPLLIEFLEDEIRRREADKDGLADGRAVAGDRDEQKPPEVSPSTGSVSGAERAAEVTLPEAAVSVEAAAVGAPAGEVVSGGGEEDSGLEGGPPGRLAGQRFPRIACETLQEVPNFIKMLAWEPKAWPVILQDVEQGHETAQLLMTGESERTITLKVGSEIPGTGCVVEKLRRRRLYTDASKTTLKNVSELHFRRLSTNEVFKALAGEPVLSNESQARLRIPGTGREWSAVTGDEFRLGSVLLQVKEIAGGGMELENRLTRETVKVVLARPD